MDEGVAACNHEWLLIGYLLNPARDYFQYGTIKQGVFACVRCGRVLPNAKEAKALIASSGSYRHH